MRSSDWSSDVCSSDLICRADGVYVAVTMQATGECPPRMSARWKAGSWSGKPGDGERVGGRHWPVGGGERIASAAPAEPPSGARLAACCSGRLDPAVLDGGGLSGEIGRAHV